MNIIKEMRLETERLVIRPYIEADLMESFELMQDKDLYKYMNFGECNLEEYKDKFKWLMSCYEASYEGFFQYSFAIFLKETGKFVGWCGVGDNECYNYYPDKEIYFMIGKKYQNKGYATEAMAELIRFCFNQMKLNRLVAFANQNNIASNKAIQKLGFKFQHIVEGMPEDIDFYNGENYYLLTK